MNPNPHGHRPVFLVSGGTGSTARSVLQAALRQFGDAGAYTRTFHSIREDDLEEIFQQAARDDALVVWTLVRQEARQRATDLSARYNVPSVDVLGPLLDNLEAFLEQTAAGEPGLLHRADDRYYARIAAIEFTLNADDGRNPHHLEKADIVLLGVSRTGKTPLSTYLAHRGFKVGNVPIVLDQPPPEALFRVDPRKVFALTIDPVVLQRIRSVRLQAMRMPTGTNYSDMGYILADLEHADKLYRSGRWPIIDVTNRAIEESAGLILRRMEEHGLLDARGDPTL